MTGKGQTLQQQAAATAGVPSLRWVLGLHISTDIRQIL
jgi:hypothetical protein